MAQKSAAEKRKTAKTLGIGAEDRYSEIIENSKATIDAMDNKPHIRMIRYLLTKRFGLNQIRMELNSLSCSCPHEEDLKLYYIGVIDPLIQKHGLQDIYSTYKGKMLKINGEKNVRLAGDILNFLMEFDTKRDLQPKFLMFLKDLEIEELWQAEIYKYYGEASKFPVDENGNKIFALSYVKKTVDKIVSSPKRYVVDKFICEGVPTTKIVEFCNKKLDMNLDIYDVNSYKKIFFNIKTQDVEGKIKLLEVENNNLRKEMSDIELDASLSIGEKTMRRKSLQERIANISSNIKALNSWQSELMTSQTRIERYDYESMFKDMSVTLYDKFRAASNLPTVDAIDFLVKTSKTITTLHDKIQEIEKYNDGKANSTGLTDTYSNQEIIKLATKNAEESFKEIRENSNQQLIELGYEGLDDVDPDEIAGADELYVSFDAEDEKEE